METNEQLHKLGKPCSKGHNFEDTGLCLRYRASGRCVECRRQSTAQWVSDNPTEVKRQRRDYYEGHKEEKKGQSREWAKANPEKRAAIIERYETNHADEIRLRRRARARAAYTRTPAEHRARTLINTHVRRDKLPHPNTLPCADCGHVWHYGDARHEYDHFEGYEGALALRVEAVCRPCHVVRTTNRKEKAA